MAADPRTAPWRKVPLRSKYGNKKTEVGGIVFDSKREARHWLELQAREQAGEIFNLRRQVTYEIIPPVVLDGRRRPATKYIADFVYIDKDGNEVVVDAKSVATKTPADQLKRKLMRHVHGIEVLEL